MKVHELIKALSEKDQEMMVVISGYEGGVTEVKAISEERVYLNRNTEWYYGEHEPVSSFNKQSEGDILVLQLWGNSEED